MPEREEPPEPPVFDSVIVYEPSPGWIEFDPEPPMEKKTVILLNGKKVTRDFPSEQKLKKAVYPLPEKAEHVVARATSQEIVLNRRKLDHKDKMKYYWISGTAARDGRKLLTGDVKSSSNRLKSSWGMFVTKQKVTPVIRKMEADANIIIGAILGSATRADPLRKERIEQLKQKGKLIEEENVKEGKILFAHELHQSPHKMLVIRPFIYHKAMK